MNDFSIENSIQNINSEKTKEYFKEVSSSYFNGNYRASIVTLYSVVINDILVKLEALEEIYSDEIAKQILDEIRASQKANPTHSEWEKDILEKVKSRTSLFDNVDYAHILALKNDRHLCAHPVIDKEFKLYTPNKETVASHIRNMLESLFLKPAILSKKILKTILIDISNKKDLLIDDQSLEKYLKSKYLNNLNDNIEISIFRDLWKFVFYLNNTETEENRLINYRFLHLLYTRNTSLCIQKIKNDKEYFSNIFDTESTVNFLIRFLAESEFLYKEFREDIHLLITKYTEKDASAKIVAWFIDKDYINHLVNIKQQIISGFNGIYRSDASGLAYRRLLNIGILKGFNKEVNEFIIWRYSTSANYNDADNVFFNIVEPYLLKFNENELVELCTKINSNSQVCDRIKSIEDHKIIKKYIIEKNGEDFDFNKYSNVF